MDKEIKEFTMGLTPLGYETPRECILVWTWDKVPMFVRHLSEYGGDEDGAVWIPRGLNEPFWLEKLWVHYGEPDRYQFSDGMLVIWAHS